MSKFKNLARLWIIILLASCEKRPNHLEKYSVQIPKKTLTFGDLNLSERQGILYFGPTKYSGYVIESYPNKTLASKNSYLGGKLEGKQEKWYPDGTKMEVRYYHENRKVGKHNGWWENKQPKFEYFIDQDIPVKVHREWYSNGQLYTLSNYNKEGQPDGDQKMWFETGQIKANYRIKNGRRFGFLGAKGCMGENEKKQTGLNFKKR